MALLETALAQAAVGEGEKGAVKALQGEQQEVAAKIAGRAGARAKIERALEAAQEDDARALRVANVAKAKAWLEKINSASDDLAAALRTVAEKVGAVQRLDAEMPRFIVEAKSSVAPPIRPWLADFHEYIKWDQFDYAIGAAYGQKGILTQIIREIEMGAESRAERRARTGLAG